jgi:hypothetical protein
MGNTDTETDLQTHKYETFLEAFFLIFQNKESRLKLLLLTSYWVLFVFYLHH